MPKSQSSEKLSWLQRLSRLWFGYKDTNKQTNIVIIDDTEVNRTFFCRVLERRGYTVFTATNGPDGIELVRKHKPKIVLLDFVMPKMKGPEVCRIIKQTEETKNTPVLFLTSVDAPTDIIECYEQGAENFLTKPIQAGELVKHVELILDDYKDPKRIPM